MNRVITLRCFAAQSSPRATRLRCYDERHFSRVKSSFLPSLFSARDVTKITCGGRWQNYLSTRNGFDIPWQRVLSTNVAASAARDPSSPLSQDLNMKISSLSESGDIAKAGELLNQTQSEALILNKKELLPDIGSYTDYMNALLNAQKQMIGSDQESAARIVALADKAHDLLVQMEDISGVSDKHSSMRLSGVAISELRQPTLRPATFHYDSVILSFANATIAAQEANYSTNFTMNAPYLSRSWLQRMETLALDPSSGISPTVESYHHVMAACSATAMPNMRSKAALLTQAIFDKLKHSNTLSPTVQEYRLMLRTWCASLCKDSAFKATGVWMSMQRAFRMGDEAMEPTLEDGKMVLEAWSRATNKHSARRAQNILTEMEKLYMAKKTTVRPDLDCYRFVLIAMSRSKVPEVGTNIPAIFKALEDNQLFPDTECFDLAIETLTNCTKYSRDDEAYEFSKMTERMLVQMEKEHDRSSVSFVKPSAKSYTNVIQALAARKTKHAAEKAAALLKRMEVEFAAGDKSMKPTRDSYVGVIHAYGTSGSGKSFIKANEVLQRMITQYLNGNEAARPDSCSYHAVIKACARVPNSKSATPEREKEALLVAISTVERMKKSDHVHPNAKSYFLLLQCCVYLLPPGNERERALCSVFRSCTKDGLVSQQILQEFQSATSAETYHREVVSDAPYYDNVRIIPEKWTRNLGYRVRVRDNTQEGGGIGKRSPIISVTGTIVSSNAYNDHRMRRRWLKKGQQLLQGGRV
ncbi:hypothetical protein ACHAWX_007371 [Stephanocyclus meneghinianus]